MWFLSRDHQVQRSSARGSPGLFKGEEASVARVERGDIREMTGAHRGKPLLATGGSE